MKNNNMNAAIQTTGYEPARTLLTVSGGGAADTDKPETGQYSMLHLAGGLQAWVLNKGVDGTAVCRQAAGEGYLLYIHDGFWHESQPAFRLHFGPAHTAGLLPPVNDAARRIIISVSRHWLDSFFNTGLKTMVLSQQLQALPGGAYHQPLPADWEFLALQVLEGEGSTLFTMNRLLLLFEKFVNRLNSMLDNPDGFTVFPDGELARLQHTERELRSALCGPAPTIGQLARKAAMSPTKLKKIFRDVYGAPIYQYYQKIRMRHARMLLESGEYTVKEAGLKIGYTNLSHFSSAFRKEFGLLPSQLAGGTGVQEFTYKVLE